MENFEEKQRQLMLLKKKTSRIALIIFFITLFVIVILIKNGIDYCVKNPSVNVHLVVFLIVISFFTICIFAFIVDSKINRKDKTKIFNLINEMHKDYKKLVLNCFKDVFENITYKDNKGLEIDDVSKADLISTGDRFHSNDYLSAQYKGVQFKFSDIHIEERVEEEDSDGKVHIEYETIFRGQWYEFEFNKQFKSNVKVYETNRDSLKRYKSNRILLEDIEFNNKFIVYADNELDAFYVLTPNIMEKIKELSIKLSDGLSFGFIDNKLYIAVDSYKDMFELNIYLKFNLEEEIKKINDNIKIICDFVDALNLDKDLFRREV